MGRNTLRCRAPLRPRRFRLALILSPAFFPCLLYADSNTQTKCEAGVTRDFDRGPALARSSVDPEQLRGGAAEDRDAVVVAEAGCRQDAVDRDAVPWERVVGAEDQLAGAGFGDYPQLAVEQPDRRLTPTARTRRSRLPQPRRPAAEEKAHPIPDMKDGQLYFDSIMFTGEAMRHLIVETGVGQIMIGTDYPFPWNKVPVDHVMSTPGLSDDDKIAILGGTAAKLLGIEN